MTLDKFDSFAPDDRLTFEHIKTIKRKTGKKINSARLSAIIDEELTFKVTYTTTLEKRDNSYYFSETKTIERIIGAHDLNKNPYHETLYLSENGTYAAAAPMEDDEAQSPQNYSENICDEHGEIKGKFAYLQTLLNCTQTLEERDAPSYNTPPTLPGGWREIPSAIAVFFKWLARKILLDTPWIGYPISWLITTIANSENPHYVSNPSVQLGKTLRNLIFPGGSDKPVFIPKNEHEGAKIVIGPVFYAQIKALKKFDYLYRQPFTQQSIKFNAVEDVTCTIRGQECNLSTIYGQNSLVDNPIDATHILYFNGNSGTYQQDYRYAAEDALRFSTEHNLLLLDCGTEDEKFDKVMKTKYKNDLLVLFKGRYYFFNAQDKTYEKIEFSNLDALANQQLIALTNRCTSQAQFANQFDISFLKEHALLAGTHEKIPLPGQPVAVTLFNYPGVLDSQGKVEITEDLFESARAQVEYLHHNRHIPYDKIVLKGGSMGGGVSATVAAHYAKRGIFLRLYLTNPIGSTPDTGKFYLNKALGNNWFSTIISSLAKPFIKLGTWGSEWTIDTGKAFYSLPVSKRFYAVVRSPKAHRDQYGAVDDKVLGLGLLGTPEKLWNRFLTKIGFHGDDARRNHPRNNRNQKMMVVDATQQCADPTTGKLVYAPKVCGHAVANCLYLSPDGRFYNPNKLGEDSKSKKIFSVNPEGEGKHKSQNSPMIGLFHQNPDQKSGPNLGAKALARESAGVFRQTVFNTNIKAGAGIYRSSPPNPL